MSRHGLTADQLALIAPHRVQNNATTDRLGRLLEGTGERLSLIDTLELVKGAEWDVILFAFTTSDPDHITSKFLNNPNRFNLEITRVRQRLIEVGSRMFFSTVPQMEEALKANSCFKALYEFCRERSSLFSGGMEPRNSVASLICGQAGKVRLPQLAAFKNFLIIQCLFDII